MKKKIIVIGSGFGGLGAACRIASHGYDVEIFEKRDKPGGRGYVYEINGFKFDGGPTVVTAPFMFDDIFKQAGKDRSDYFDIVPVDPFYRIFNAEGKVLNYNNNTDFIFSEIEKFNQSDIDGYRRFLDTTKPIFEKGFLQLADKPFSTIGDMLKVAPDLIKLQSYKSVYSYVSQFIQNDFLRQVFSFHPLLIGGNPYDSSSIYAMIHFLEREWGVFYAKGGTGSIVNGLVRLLQDLGGSIMYNAEVVEILSVGRKVTGVRLADGSIHHADLVVSNMDSPNTYMKLIPAANRKVNSDRKLSSYRYSMSLFVIYFGTRRRYLDSRLAHHNIILGPRYKGLLSDIFNRHVLAEDFSLYLHMPTITDPSIAPEGCESFYVLSPVPHLDANIDWTRQARPYRDAIMEFLEQNYLPDLRNNIIAEHYIDPLHFQNILNSYKGAAFSVQPILTQSAWFRPHNQSEDFVNLVLVGAGTHPGAGLPGVLSSSKIAEDLVNQYFA